MFSALRRHPFHPHQSRQGNTGNRHRQPLILQNAGHAPSAVAPINRSLEPWSSVGRVGLEALASCDPVCLDEPHQS